MPHAALHSQELSPCPKLHAKEEKRQALLHSFIVRETETQRRGDCLRLHGWGDGMDAKAPICHPTLVPSILPTLGLALGARTLCQGCSLPWA